jgi:prepilin-type N-terminal cleavage/methylation domain-containing protein
MSLSLKLNKQRGFTLLEVMLSVAIIALIAGLGTPIYQGFQVRNDLDVAANSISTSLRRAQILSQAVDGDTSWGLSIQSGAITLFRGVSYASRSAEYDEVFDLQGSITPSGVSEIVYEKFTGIPQTTGTIILTSNANEIRNITINEKGTISY